MRVSILGKYWTLRFVKNLGRRTRGRELLVVQGDCDSPADKDRKMRIQAGLRGQELLDTLIHECLHAADWHKDEAWVTQVSRDIAAVVYKLRERIFVESGGEEG